MTKLHIVFDGPPSHESGRFVEVENRFGRSVRVGEWVQKGEFWHLILSPDDFPTEEEDAEEARDHGPFGAGA